MTTAYPYPQYSRPLVPEDIDRRAGETLWRRSFVRAATAKALGRIQKISDEEVLGTWPDDGTARMITRGAVVAMERPDFPGSSVVRLMQLAPTSAAAKLAELAIKVDLQGIAQFSFPLPTSFTAAKFIAEGDPIPVGQGAFAGQMVGPTKKVALIAALSNELEFASAGLASTVIDYLLRTSVGKGLDAVMFSNAAASDAAPAGLLNGVTPLTAVAGGGFNAIVGDLRNLIAAIASSGIDTSSIAFVMSAGQAVPLGLITVPGMAVIPKIIAAPYLASGTIIAVATAGLAIAGDGVPSIDISKSATLHMADPAVAIGSAGTPNAVAATTTSMFQTDSFALRCIADLTWSAAPGAIAYTTAVTW